MRLFTFFHVAMWNQKKELFGCNDNNLAGNIQLKSHNNLTNAKTETKQKKCCIVLRLSTCVFFSCFLYMRNRQH